MDNSQQTFSSLIKELGYNTSPNFISSETPDMHIPEELRVLWSETNKKLSVDAVYFIANAPIIYFKQFEVFNLEDIAELHRNIWNQSQVPLIFVILPNDIRIYCGYEAPSRPEHSKSLKEPTRLDQELATSKSVSSSQVWDNLKIFARTAMESGSFWHTYSKYFRKETRVDQTLIANLRYVRQELIKLGNLKPEHAHSLIGRSIFALYLQDREVLPKGQHSFFAERYKGSHYTHYTDILSSPEHTYDFFGFLYDRFNGDMFPVTEEEKQDVTQEHLKTLQRLFTVDQEAGGQMLFFWAYNFKFIPLELISSIYEEFLHQEESGRNGTYYTPPTLVDFILNQVMPWTDNNYKLQLLDPACGSGIFLVKAYHRLIERWVTQNRQNISFKVLSDILTTSIFGVDIKRQALRIAAFSLYLAMLDYLEPKSIWMDVHFPPLLETNLIEADFFDEHVTFEKPLFDLVVGNPPWESKLTNAANNFLLEKKMKVGDKQIVQAFLMRAPDFCLPSGQVALLCSSKSLLFNKSSKNLLFRKTFFSRFSVKTIFDFSALRRHLFEKGLGPASAVFYIPQRPSPKDKIFYGAPKPTYFSRLLSAIIIDANDLKHIPLRQVLNSIESMLQEDTLNHQLVKQQTLFNDNEGENRATNIWKIALWGTSYDYTLIQNLNDYPSLGEVIRLKKWHSKGGFNKNGPGKLKSYKWLDDAYYLDAKYLTQYGIDSQVLKMLPKGLRYYRGGDQAVFKAPHVLFKRGQTQRRPCAAYLDIDCTFSDAITGISGSKEDIPLLKALAALLNSEIAQYYLFLTSASWGVEREEIKAGEVRALPFPFLKADVELIYRLGSLVDQLAELNILKAGFQKTNKTQNVQLFTDNNQLEDVEEKIKSIEDLLNESIYECFALDKQEISLIKEVVKYVIGFFNSPDNSLAQKIPNIDMLIDYAQTYNEAMNFYLEPIGKKMIANIYNIASYPLVTIQFYSAPLDSNKPNIVTHLEDPSLNEISSILYELSHEPIGSKIYHRRNYRIYDKTKDTLSFIKPAEQQQWTISSALSDAEKTVLEMSNNKEMTSV